MSNKVAQTCETIFIRYKNSTRAFSRQPIRKMVDLNELNTHHLIFIVKFDVTVHFLITHMYYYDLILTFLIDCLNVSHLMEHGPSCAV